MFRHFKTSGGHIPSDERLCVFADGVAVSVESYYPKLFMHTLTLKIPDELNAALRTASTRRQMGKFHLGRPLQFLRPVFPQEARWTPYSRQQAN
jgi:hypothetical protein